MEVQSEGNIKSTPKRHYITTVAKNLTPIKHEQNKNCKGKYTKITGGDHYMFSDGNIISSAGGKYEEQGMREVSSLVTPNPMSLGNLIPGMTGIIVYLHILPIKKYQLLI